MYDFANRKWREDQIERDRLKKDQARRGLIARLAAGSVLNKCLNPEKAKEPGPGKIVEALTREEREMLKELTAEDLLILRDEYYELYH